MILRLVVLYICGGIGLVPKPEPVYEADATFPVALERVTRDGTVNVILPACKIPEEIPPIHPIYLIIKEICDILPECGFQFIGAFYLYTFVPDI